MSSTQGKFVWYELMTTDAQAAENFYCNVVGWSARDAGMPNLKYTLLSIDSMQVAGLVQFPAEACASGAARPGWLGYVGVDDVDEVVEHATSLGAKVHHAATDIPEVGRFAILADPQGAMFAVFKGLGDAPEAAPMTPGRPSWHELHAVDWEKVFPFYSSLFGWQKLEALDMGAMGTYQIFGQANTMGMGGMMTKTEQEPVPYWLYYIAVADIDAAIARVNKSGGKVLRGPDQVPGGSWIVQGFDPQGGAFALVGQRPNA